MASALYHYTGPEGLAGILSSRTIWATDLRYLNDSSEFTYAIELARDELTRWPHGDIAYFPAFKEEVLQHLTQIEGYVFVTSLSEESDLLSQWRGYCSPGPGFAVGISRDYIAKLSTTPVIAFNQCVYAKDEQVKRIDNLIRQAVAALPRGNVKPPTTANYKNPEEYKAEVRAVLRGVHIKRFSALVTAFINSLLDLAAVFKNPTFNEESEWRVVIRSSDAASVRHRAGKSFLIPYIPLPLDLTERGAIREIVVGPSPHPQLSAASVRAYALNTLGYAPDITLSSVPYRFW